MSPGRRTSSSPALRWLGALCCCAVAACTEPSPTTGPNPDAVAGADTADEHAVAEPGAGHGHDGPPDGTCGPKGCSVKLPPAPSADELAALLVAYGKEDATVASTPLDTLLFFRYATLAHLGTHGAGGLPAAHEAFLRRELSRDHAYIAMRLVNEKGEVRADLGERRVPLGRKTHQWFHDRHDLQEFNTNGTVVRVGLGHIWSRY
jgi:hypothetical protein